MYRYLTSLITKFIRILRILSTHLIYYLLTLKSWNYRPIFIYLLLVSLSTIVLTYLHSDGNVSSSSLEEFFLDNTDDHETIQCRFPKLLLNADGLNLFQLTELHPKCQTWFYPVEIKNYHIRLILSNLTCDAIFYLSNGDQPARKVSVRLIYNLDIPLLNDHFTVQCEDPKGKTFYPKIPYAKIHYDSQIRQRLEQFSKQEDDFDVLVLGFDGVSNLQFQRMLPQSYAYLTETLDSTILKGYNILGDGTPQQLIPMLTGFKEIELPSTLHRDQNGSFVNVYPFVWKKFRENGFVTGYAEDRPEYGIWTLRLRGFNETPTDHFLSTFYHMDATYALLHHRDTHCIGNQTTLELFLSYVDDFWSAYKKNKKFYFGFFKQYTHDGYQSGGLLDNSVLNFLKEYSENEKYRQTILILMTDHGARFSMARQTSQGKLEERLPFLSFVFPDSFRKNYPYALKNLEKNIHRLTTPFDLHSTLLSLIDMKNVNYKIKHSVKRRNITLFNLIPAQRTCDDLELEPHWCSCLQWRKLEIKDTIVQQAAISILEYMNKELSLVKDHLCQQLELQSITSAQMYRPNKALLTFSRSSDIDGRIPKYGDRKTDITFYQILFETKPNHGIYEATTQYSNRTKVFAIDLNQISRLNAYKSSASCIEKSYPHLRKFCRCIK